MFGMSCIWTGKVAENNGDQAEANNPCTHDIERGYNAKLHQNLTFSKIQYTKANGCGQVCNKCSEGNSFDHHFHRLELVALSFKFVVIFIDQ